MAGSFKSMVWDYYLPTDMHEASFILVITDYNVAYIKSLTVVAALACIIVFIISMLREKNVDIAGRIIGSGFAVKLGLALIVIFCVQLSYSMTGVSAGFMYANF